MSYAYLVIMCLILALAGRYGLKVIATRLSYRKKLSKYGCEQPPSYPHTEPFLGTDLAKRIKQAMHDGILMQFARQNFKTYGKTFRAKLMGKTVLYTMDPHNIQTVVALEFEKFGVEPLRQATSGSWMGKGIFVTDGQVWDHARKTLRPVFHRAQVGNLAAFEKHVSRMIDLIPRDSSTVDLQTLFHRLVSSNSAMKEILGPAELGIS